MNPDEYTIYVHPQKGFRFRNTSFFHGREIAHTVQTIYLKASVQLAEKALLKAALEDKDNAYFCLISESCVPLHPFQAMKHALRASGRSIVNACRQGIYHDGMTEVDARWRHGLDLVPNLNRSMWRKSLQQFSLTRKHAELVASDEILFNAFEDVPIPDEHYIPTLLAWKGVENETTCAGGFSYVRFGVSGVHPRTFGPSDITPELFHRLEMEDIATSGFAQECSGTELCHFTARKFSADSRNALLDNIGVLLSDEYKPPDEYPSSVQSIFRDISNNGTHRSWTPRELQILEKIVPMKENTVIKARSDRVIYLIQNFRRRAIPSMKTFVSMGFDLDNVTIVTNDQLNLIPLGSPIDT